jgi:hypothetical protein
MAWTVQWIEQASATLFTQKMTCTNLEYSHISTDMKLITISDCPCPWHFMEMFCRKIINLNLNNLQYSWRRPSSIYSFWLPLWYLVCPSSIYGFWLPLWYFQTYLNLRLNNIYGQLHFISFFRYKAKTNAQTFICKTLHRKLKIEQHEPNWKRGDLRRVSSFCSTPPF